MNVKMLIQCRLPYGVATRCNMRDGIAMVTRVRVRYQSLTLKTLIGNDLNITPRSLWLASRHYPCA